MPYYINHLIQGVVPDSVVTLRLPKLPVTVDIGKRWSDDPSWDVQIGGMNPLTFSILLFWLQRAMGAINGVR